MIQSTMSRPKPGSRKPVFLSRNDCREIPVTYPFLLMAAASSGVSMRMNCASSETWKALDASAPMAAFSFIDRPTARSCSTNGCGMRPFFWIGTS